MMQTKRMTEQAAVASRNASLLRRALTADHWPTLLVVLVVAETAAVGTELALLASVGEVRGSDALLRLVGLFVAVSFARIVLSASLSVFREMWQVGFTEQLLLASATSTCDRPDLYNDRELAASRVSAALSNGYMVTANIVHFCSEVLRCGLQYVALAVVYCVILGWELALPLAFGMLLTLALAKKFQALSQECAEATEQARIELGNTFSSVWEGVVLGNRSWSVRWFDAFARAIAPYRVATRRQCKNDLLLQTSQVLVTYGAFACAAAWMISRDSGSEALLIGLLASMPKFVQLLSLQSQFSQYLIGFGFLRGQWKILEESIGRPPHRDIEGRVLYNAISVKANGAVQRRAQDLLSTDWYVDAPAQRLTLRGPNGSGKTSMLLALKAKFGSSALLVPADAARVAGTDDQLGSTGERQLRLLKDALAEGQESVLLLDEWDAHLDDQRVAAVETLISKAVSNGRIVIETRHRADSALLAGVPA